MFLQTKSYILVTLVQNSGTSGEVRASNVITFTVVFLCGSVLPNATRHCSCLLWLCDTQTFFFLNLSASCDVSLFFGLMSVQGVEKAHC